VLSAFALQLALPESLLPGPKWLPVGIEAALLATLIVVNPTRIHEGSRELRWVSTSLVVVLTVVNGATLGVLVKELLDSGSPIDGRRLITSAVAVWSTNVIAFGVWYWELDRGGPIRRCRVDHGPPDLSFPQMDDPSLVRNHAWHPRFADYLYVSLTNSSAFSPTDALPLTLRTKGLMAAQALMSLTTIVLVGARAVNILR
jgi:hypothetical protein